MLSLYVEKKDDTKKTYPAMIPLFMINTMVLVATLYHCVRKLQLHAFCNLISLYACYANTL